MSSFKQVGVRAVVEDVDKFLADVSKMVSAISKFQKQAGQNVADVAAKANAAAAARAQKKAADETAAAAKRQAAVEAAAAKQRGVAAAEAARQARVAAQQFAAIRGAQQGIVVSQEMAVAKAQAWSAALARARRELEAARAASAAQAQGTGAQVSGVSLPADMGAAIKFANANLNSIKVNIAGVKAELRGLGPAASAGVAKMASAMLASSLQSAKATNGIQKMLAELKKADSISTSFKTKMQSLGAAIKTSIDSAARSVGGIGPAMDAAGAKIQTHKARLEAFGKIKLGLIKEFDKLGRELEQGAGKYNALVQQNAKLEASSRKLGAAMAKIRGEMNKLEAAMKSLPADDPFFENSSKISQLSNAFARLEGALKDLGRQQEQVNSRIKENKNAMGLLSQSGRATVVALRGIKDAMAGIDGAANRSAAALTRLSVSMFALRGAGVAAAAGLSLFRGGISAIGTIGGAGISVLSGAFSALGAVITIPHNAMKSFGGMIESVGQRMKKQADAWFKYGNSLRFFGQSLLFIITLPIVGFLTLLTKEAIAFEDAWAGVVKTVNDSDFRLVEEGATSVNDLTALGENLQKVFRELALVIPIPTVELLNLGRVAGQMGVRGVANLRAFVQVAAQLGVTTDIASEDAAKSLGRLIALTGNLTDAELSMIGFSSSQIRAMSTSQRFQQTIRALGGALVHMGNNMAATESEIVKLAEKIAATGSVVAGFTGVQILGIAAAFRASGIAAEKGGTAFTKVLFNISEAVQTGNDHLRVFATTAGFVANELGTAGQQFAELWRADPAEAFRRFVEGLKFQGDEVINTFIGIEEESARLKEAFLSLSKTGLLTDILGDSKNIGLVAEAIANTSDSLNALEIEAALRFSTTQSQLQLLKNSFTELGITIGTFLLPIINSVAKQMIVLANVVADLDPGLQKFVIILGLIAAAAGPAVIGLGLFLSSMGAIVSNIAHLIAIVGGIGAAFGAIAAPIGLVVVALAGIGVAFAATISRLRSTSESGFKAFGKRMYEYGKNLVIQFSRGMAAAVGAVLKVLAAIGRAIAGWLRPGSPPKLLPDLDKWGRQAMQEYMDGWTTADFGVFNQISDRIENLLRSVTPDGGPALIERIFASREAVAEMLDQITRFGKVTQEHLDNIFEAMGGVSQNTANYIRRLFELTAATEKVSRAQDNLNKITARYEQALRPLNDRLAEISRRQKEIQSQARIIELEAILADSSSTDIAKELAALEIEQIGIEADVTALNKQKDIETELAEQKLAAAKAEEEAAKELLAAAEALLEVQDKNNDLWQEMLKAIEEIEEGMEELNDKMKKAAEETGDAMVDIADGFQEELESSIEDIDLGGLFDLDAEMNEIADAISAEWNLLKDQILEDWQPVIDLWNSLGDTWLPIFTFLAEELGEFLPTVQELDTAFRNIDTATTNFANTVEQVLTPIIGDLLAILVDLGLLEEEDFNLPHAPKEDTTGLYELYLKIKINVENITGLLRGTGQQWQEGFQKGLAGIDFITAAQGIIGGTPIDVDTLLNDFLTSGLTPELAGKLGGSVVDFFNDVAANVQENLPAIRTSFQQAFEAGLSGEETLQPIIEEMIRDGFDPEVFARVGADINIASLFDEFLRTGATPQLTGKTVGFITRLVAGFGQEFIRQHRAGNEKIRQAILDANEDIDFTTGLEKAFVKFKLFVLNGDVSTREALGSLQDGLQKFADSPVIQAIIDVFEDPALGKVISDIGDDLEEIGKIFSDFFEEIGGGGDIDPGALTEILDTLIFFGSGIAKLVGLVASVLGGAGVAASFGFFIGTVSVIVESAKNIIQGVLNIGIGMAKVLDGIFRTIAAFGTLVKEIFTGGDIREAFATFMESLNGVGEQIKAGVSRVWEGLNQIGKGIVEFLFSILWGVAGAVRGIITYFQGLWPDIEKILGEFVTGVIAFFTNLWNSLVGHSIVPEMIAAIIAAFDGLAAIPAKVGAFVAQIFAKFGEMKKNILDSIETMKTTISEIFDKIKAAIEEKVGEMKTRAGELWEEFKTEATEKLEEIWQSFIDGPGEKIEEFAGKVREFVQAGVNAITEFVDDFFTAGANIIQGLINGILSIDIVDTIGNVAQSVIDAVSNRFQEQSPSQVFFGIGSNVMLGLLYGLQTGNSMILSALTMLTSAILAHVTLWAGQMKVAFGNMMVLVAEAIAEGQDSIMELFTTLMEEVMLVWEDGLLIPLIGEEGIIVSLTKDIKEMFDEMISKIKKQTEDLAESVIKAFVNMGFRMAGLKEELTNAATEMMSGLKQAIEVAAQEAEAAGVAAANAIINAFQQAIDKINEANDLASGGGGGNTAPPGPDNGASGAPVPPGAGTFAAPPPVTIPVEFIVSSAPAPVAPVINMGGQTINNGMDGHRLTLIIENALADALRYRTK